MDYKQLTEKVCTVAREAGAYQKREQTKLRDEQVEQKHSHDYVSYVDKESERMIVAQLKELLPEAGFITEEGTESRQSSSLYWVVDPLDGTTNYVHGYHSYAVCIGLRDAHEVLLGVVYDVCLDECFYAWKGGGAWLDGRRIHTNSQHDITQALLGIELPYDADDYRPTGLHLISHFYGLCGGIRMTGSAALAICNVASGRFDGWLERGLGLWDHTAASAVLLEAGGHITRYDGNPDYIDHGDIIVSNGTIHQALLDEIRKIPNEQKNR